MALADIIIKMTFFGWNEIWAASRSEKAPHELKRSAAAVYSGKERLIPSELVFRELGLESSTDDCETDYQESLDNITYALNELERHSLITRTSDLEHRL